jgi:hypothetical protein
MLVVAVTAIIVRVPAKWLLQASLYHTRDINLAMTRPPCWFHECLLRFTVFCLPNKYDIALGW